MPKKDCCAVPANVVTDEQGVEVCQVCGLKHYHLKAEVGGLVGTLVGSERKDS